MAKARATCTCATCGKVFEITAMRHNSREARSFEEWAEKNITECKECEAKRIDAKRAEENARAAASAADKGWPELTGSEKQVAWARTIREKEIQPMYDWLEELKNRRTQRVDTDSWRLALTEVLKNTRASWWIDNQGYIESKVETLLIDIQRNPKKYELYEQAAKDEKAANEETINIAEPAEKKHEGIVDIRASEQRVTAAYRKDDDFRELVKSLGYSWMASEGVWGMTIGLRTGTAAERAAELGNKLLNAGFAIRIQDAETLRNAIEGNYEPMTHRWIAKLDEDFYITWAYDDSFYDQARRLPGAKYKKPGMRVPAREYDAILDFARAYGFRMTPGAQELVNEMQSKSTVVTPAAPKTAEYEEHPVSDILNSSREVLFDLKD